MSHVGSCLSRVRDKLDDYHTVLLNIYAAAGITALRYAHFGAVCCLSKPLISDLARRVPAAIVS